MGALSKRRTAVWITQCSVGFLKFEEGFQASAGMVRMQLQGVFPVGGADFLASGVGVEVQDVVGLHGWSCE